MKDLRDIQGLLPNDVLQVLFRQIEGRRFRPILICLNFTALFKACNHHVKLRWVKGQARKNWQASHLVLYIQ